MDSTLSLVPTELKQRPQWVLWKLARRSGKNTKIPYQINGTEASSTNPQHWSGFSETLQAWQQSPQSYNGLGYVFSEDDPFTGIDLDDCVVDGKSITDEARSIVTRLNSYTERSQSGNGLHTIVKARMPGKRNRIGNKEMYDKARFFVVTGNHVKGTPETIEDRQEQVNELYGELFNKQNGSPKNSAMLNASSTLQDNDILSIAVKAANGNKFSTLYSGDYSEYGSQSEADLALCGILAFYTKDAEQIDRLYRGSGLMREKWDREDYSENTIGKALETTTAHYQPSIKPVVEEYSDDTEFYIDVPQEWNERIPEEALHGLAGDVVRLIEPHSEADPAALLINFITMFGNEVGTKPHFVAGGDTHHMKLFSVLVGKSFEGKKGSSLPPVISLFKAVDMGFANRKKSGLSSGEGIIHLVRDPVYQLMEKKEEGKKGKATGEFEEVLVDPGVEDKRLLLVEPEFGGVLNVMRRDGNKLSAIVREAWDGTGDIGVITKNPMRATNTHISILGHITPEELNSKMNETEMFNGFANRFLWLYVKRSKSLPSGGAFHKVDVGEIVHRITQAIEYGQDCGEIERDPEAEELWVKVYSKLETDAPGLVGAAVSRAIPYVMRLACIYALLDKTNVIGVVHLKAALALWGYCRMSATFIFGKHERYDPMVERITEGLRIAPSGELSSTDIYKGIFKNNVPSSEIAECLKKMQQNGLVTIENINKGKGRPRQIIKLRINT